MASRLLTLLLLVLSAPALLAAEPTGEKAVEKDKLVGTWRYKTEGQVATYAFRADGTFNAELKQDEGVRKFEGKWAIEWSKEENVIVYTFTGDSSGKAIGGEERDRLLRIDESSYTIQAGDGNQRTYWRTQ